MKKIKTLKKKNIIIILSLLIIVILAGISIFYKFIYDNNGGGSKYPAAYMNNSEYNESLYVYGYSDKETKVDIIEWTQKTTDNRYYLYLPSTADLSKLKVWYTFDKKVTINGKKIKSGEVTDAFKNQGEYTLMAGKEKYTVVVMQESNLPSIFISTKDNDMYSVDEDKKEKTSGKIMILDSDGKVNYEGQCSKIGARGNTTFTYDKTPYNIKLDEKSELLGMKKSKHWCLLANYRDQSLIRNQLTYDLADAAGLEYSPMSVQTNLYIDGQYLGTYQLSQKVEVGKNNLVDITNLEKETEKLNSKDLDKYTKKGTEEFQPRSNKYYEIPKEPKDITGGYLLELELSTRYKGASSGFVSSHKQSVILKSPKYASKNEVEYINEFYQDFEDALYSEDGCNSKGKSYKDYIDVDSFAKMYLLQELTENVDGGNTSFYIYKESDKNGDGKLHACCAWDYDIAFGNFRDMSRNVSDYESLYVRNNCTISEESYNYSIPTVFNKLFYHSDFEDAVKDEWNKNFKNKALELLQDSPTKEKRLKTIDEYVDNIKSSADLNFNRWNVLGTTTTEVITGKTFDENITYLKDFIQNRINYLDKYYNNENTKQKVYFDNSICDWSFVYAYCYSGDGRDAVIVPMKLAKGEDNIYEGDISSVYTNIVFKNTEGTFSWELQTGDLTLSADNSYNCYKPSSSESRSEGTWSKYN